MPDTCAPTSTVVTACTVPVARIRRVICPSVTGAVETSTSVVVRKAQAIAPPSAAMMISTSQNQIERRIAHLPLPVSEAITETEVGACAFSGVSASTREKR
jgi:hypothetical protein